MNIETLELIHKLLKEHVDNASRCCDRARGKRNSTPDDDQNYERYDDDCQSYGSKQDKDIVDLLMQVYSQGGDGK